MNNEPGIPEDRPEPVPNPPRNEIHLNSEQDETVNHSEITLIINVIPNAGNKVRKVTVNRNLNIFQINVYNFVCQTFSYIP